MQLDNCALNELRNEIGLISIDFLQLHNLHTLYMIYGAPVWTLTNTQQFETIKAKKTHSYNITNHANYVDKGVEKNCKLLYS